MFIYRTESLELLRSRIDLVEVLSPHIQLHRSGASYKACCPFHDEKTPSFIVHKGDSHYHCFGCGVHGDAIAFLMNYLKLDFVEAVESLAEKFGVLLEKEEEKELHRGTSKTFLKQALQSAARFYHFCLLHTEVGLPALTYLVERGMDLAFIKKFQIGFSLPGNLFHQVMREQGVSDPILEEVGLLVATSSGHVRDFFSDRIMFPIRDALGNVIGFSARKFKEETTGGKYINTSETPLFKKSHVLFGLSYSRRTIAKKKEALIVEGQIDALRLIDAGFDYTVAGQGTAFGEGHVKELINLGVATVFLALDGDDAGRAAAYKIGNLFQKKGVAVSVVSLPQGSDPDSFVRAHGKEAFSQLLEGAVDFLRFLLQEKSREFDLQSPSGKNRCLQTIVAEISLWEGDLFIHESVRALARLTDVKEEMLLAFVTRPQMYVRRSSKLEPLEVNRDTILETDLLRLLVLIGGAKKEETSALIETLVPEQFKDEHARRLFCLIRQHTTVDRLSLMVQLESNEERLFFAQMMEKRVNTQKVFEGLREAHLKLLERDWIEKREALQRKIHSGTLPEEELLALAKELSLLKKPPFV